MNHYMRGRSFDDSDAYFGNNKQAGRARGLPESNVLKSMAADNVKASSVAKIKVVVCISTLSSWSFLWLTNTLLTGTRMHTFLTK